MTTRSWLGFVTGCAFLLLFLTARASMRLPLSDTLLAPQEAKFGLGASYLNSNQNFDNSGNRVTLANGGSFQSIQTIGFLEFGIAEPITGYAELPFVANNVRATGQTGPVDETSTGLGDAAIGFRYVPFPTPIRMMVDGSVLFPLYSRTTASDWSTLNASSSAPLGNGATSFSLFGSAEVPASPNISIGAGVGYTTRSSGFSNQLPYRTYARYEEERGIFARLGLTGIVSAGNDQFTATNPTPNDRSTVLIGGSQALNAINPSYLSAEAAVGVYISSVVFVNGGAQLPLLGKNSATDPSFTLVLGIDLGGKTHQSDYRHSNRGFQEYYLASKVVQANNKLRQVLIDKGKSEGIINNELLDVFEPDRPDGTFGDAVARGRVIETGATRSKLQLLEDFKEEDVEEGFVVRRPVR